MEGSALLFQKMANRDELSLSEERACDGKPTLVEVGQPSQAPVDGQSGVRFPPLVA